MSGLTDSLRNANLYLSYKVDPQSTYWNKSCWNRAYSFAKRAVESPLLNSRALQAGSFLSCSLFKNQSKAYNKTNKSQILHENNLTRNLFYHLQDSKTFPWFSEIIKDKLTVGALPLVNFGHDVELQRRGITSILSLVVKEEFAPRTLVVPFHPAKENNWKLIEVEDYCPATLDQFKKGIEWIKAQIDNGHHVYVHCKSGKGRSVSMVLLFMLIYGAKYDDKIDAITSKAIEKQSERKAQDMEKYLKTLRPQISLNSHRDAMLDAYKKLS